MQAYRVQAQTGNISFSDPLVKSLCVEAWDTNGDNELSFQEAAAVTDIGEVFKGTAINKFNEFQWFTSLQSVPNDAFRSCNKLLQIVLPPSVEQIGSYAFYSCISLSDIALNEGLKSIKNAAFTACSNISSITLPRTVEELGTNMFYLCTKLVDVNIPDKVTELPARLFYGCSSLKEIRIPDGVKTISPTAFSGCTSLTKVTMPLVLDASTLPLSVSDLQLTYLAQSEYAVLSSANKLNFSGQDDLTVYVVPSYSQLHVELQEVTGVEAFTGIIVHAQPGKRYVVSLGTEGEKSPGQNNAHRAPQARWGGDRASTMQSRENDGNLDYYQGPNFLRATSVSTTIPSQQNQNQNFVFNYRNGHYVFTAVSPTAVVGAYEAYLQLPYQDVVGVNSMAMPFDLDAEENNIYFPDLEVKSVCVAAWDTNGDGELSFDEAKAVRTLGGNFTGNKNIKQFNELKFFTSLTEISESAFDGCTELMAVMLPPNIKTISSRAFYLCYRLASLTFNNGLSTIGDNAFTSCTYFREIELPATVRTIGVRAFYYCTGLTDITIPEGVTEIGSLTFGNCTSLTSIKLPNSLISLASNAFSSCSRLETVTVPATLDASVLPASVSNVQVSILMDSNVTTLCSPNGIDFSAEEHLKAYTANSVKGVNVYLNQVMEMPRLTGMVLYGTAGSEYVLPVSNTETELDNLLVGTLEETTLQPDAIDVDGTNFTLTVRSVNVSFVKVSNPVTVKRCGAYLRLPSYLSEGKNTLRVTFVNQGNIHFNDEEVKELCVAQWDTDGDGELSYDEAAAVTDLGKSFKGDIRITSFMELEFFTNIKVIPDSAFEGCQQMTNIVFPSNLTTIGNSSFAYCYALNDIFLPDSVSTIGAMAFNGCVGLTSIVLPDAAVNLGASIFNYCTALRLVTLPMQLTYIPERMFVNCKRLTSLYIPPLVEKVGLSAFTGCSSLASIKKPAVLPDTNLPAVTDMLYYHIFSEEWEAFSAPNAIDFTSAQNGTAYAVDGYSDGVVYLTPMAAVPAATGAVLHGQIGEEMTMRKAAEATPVDNNLLVGTLEPVEVWPLWADYTNYLFSCTRDGIGFIPVSGSAFTERNSAYLALPTEMAGSFEILQMVSDDIIVFADEEVKSLCVGMWDANGDGELSLQEAAAVSNVDVFSSNPFIRYFDELKHFTSVTKLEPAAFQNCSSLRRITIPANVTEIGDLAFDGCYELYNVFFTDGCLERVGNFAFSSCVSLQQLHLPSTVKSLGNGAFNYCQTLEDVTIPDGVENIRSNTFSACEMLKSIVIPCSVKSLDETAFTDCGSLTTVTLPAVLSATLPSTVKRRYYIHRLTQEYEMFCSPYNLLIPRVTGLQVFTAPSCDGSRVMTARVDSLSAGTGVLMHGEVGQVFTFNQGKAVTNVPDNLYEGVLEATLVDPVQNDKAAFFLRNGANGYGFYRLNQSMVLGANRAYLLADLSQVGDNNFIEIASLPDIDDPNIYGVKRRGITGASEQDIAPLQTDVWFTLSGLRLQGRPTQPGIYIHNGRKEAVR